MLEEQLKQGHRRHAAPAHNDAPSAQILRRPLAEQDDRAHRAIAGDPELREQQQLMGIARVLDR
jgi:hypothetical protein